MNLLKNKIFISVFLLTTFFAFAEKADAATSYFSPSSGNFTVGNIFTVSILVNTEGVAINNAEAIINFPSTFLEIVSLGKSGSIFSLWVEEPTFSNGAGTLSFNGGAPTPGFNGSAGKILSVVFRVKKAGSASLVFSSAAVRANDGFGTNVLKAMNGASFNINAGSTPQPSPTTTPVPVSATAQRPVVTSSTHPNESVWYSNNNPVFKWETPTGVTGVVLALSRSSATAPFVSYTPPISERMLEDLGEGTWYFNARFKTAAGLGPITSFRFNIDTVSSQPFAITRLDADDPTNPRPELLFESSDVTSGIDRYEMKIGEEEWFEIKPGLAGRAYAIPLQRYGEYTIQIRAFDEAGNSADSSTGVIIEPIDVPPPFIKEVILPQTDADKVTIIKDEAEVVVKEVVVKEVVVKEVVVKEVVVKGIVVKEKVAVKIAAVIVDVLKLEGINGFGQITGALKDAEKMLAKTVEIQVDEDGNFEAKINDLDSGTYIIRTYGKDERGAVSDAYSDVVLKVAGESALAKFITGIINAVMRGFDWVVNMLGGNGLFMAFILALVGLLLVLVELFKKRFREWINKKRNLIALKQIQKKSNKNVVHIIKDMQDELTFLNQISKRRLLSTEEKYLKNKISVYIKMLKLIDEEIDK